MAEHSDKLRGTLQELEAELASVDSLDEETRSALETLMVEIGQALGKPTLPESRRREDLTSRLQDAAEQFETSHPTLFGIISRTIDALGQMGI